MTDAPAATPQTPDDTVEMTFGGNATRSLDPAVPVVTTPAAARDLAGRGFSATSDLEPWQTHVLTRGTATLRVTAVPAVHGPGLLATVLPPVVGSVLELVRGDGDGGAGTVRWRGYVSGDTLFRPFLGEVLERCGPR